MTSIIGIHIPKTAGTSLRVAIEEGFSGDEVAYLYRLAPGVPLSRLLRWLEAERRKPSPRFPRVIYGHMGFGLHELMGVGARYLTILREPLRRAVSLYRHEQRNQHALFHDVAARRTLAEFFRAVPSPVFENSMTRMIAGTLWQEGDWFVRGSEADVLRRAQQNLLEHFDYVGFTETISEDEEILSRVLARPVRIGRHNQDTATMPLDELSKDDITAVESRFGLDFELYEYAWKQRYR